MIERATLRILYGMAMVVVLAFLFLFIALIG